MRHATQSVGRLSPFKRANIANGVTPGGRPIVRLDKPTLELLKELVAVIREGLTDHKKVCSSYTRLVQILAIEHAHGRTDAGANFVTRHQSAWYKALSQDKEYYLMRCMFQVAEVVSGTRVDMWAVTWKLAGLDWERAIAMSALYDTFIRFDIYKGTKETDDEIL